MVLFSRCSFWTTQLIVELELLWSSHIVAKRRSISCTRGHWQVLKNLARACDPLKLDDLRVPLAGIRGSWHQIYRNFSTEWMRLEIAFLILHDRNHMVVLPRSDLGWRAASWLPAVIMHVRWILATCQVLRPHVGARKENVSKNCFVKRTRELKVLARCPQL
jgi:hypothetical protein